MVHRLKTILDEYAARLSRRYRTPVSEPVSDTPSEPVGDTPSEPVGEPVGDTPSEPAAAGADADAGDNGSISDTPSETP